MILYHGSNIKIGCIDLTKSKRYKDFGRAFYLSAEEEQAQKMADAKTIQFGGTAVVTAFEYDEESCASLSVMTFPHYGLSLFITTVTSSKTFSMILTSYMGLLPTTI